jgi:predicted ATPase/class 3 adenylate cyclase
MSELPSGTVTFLFTDIEGSTKRWEHDAGVMRSALGRHNALLDEAVARHGGRAFKTIGDAIQAAFPTAAEALAAAAEAQRGLYDEDWAAFGEAAIGLRVRMAVHTGSADPVDGDYLAPCLNRLARLLQATHGGQVLVSQASAQLAQDPLPSSLALKELGRYRLRDLLEPERVFQLLIPGLPEAFPPPRTLDQHPHNLPLALTSLVGREQEIAEAEALLLRPEIRLVTLTGPGGVGKTRFALQLAAELIAHFEDGVFLVPLAAVSEPAQVPSAIADALGVHEAGGRGLVDCLREALRSRQLLLVLDNFEHVVEAAPVVSELLAACPQLEALVTSRELLRLRGEHEFRVAPLGLPGRAGPAGELGPLSQYAAVELFIQRAQEVQPDFQVTNDTAPAVAEICARLDGLPLAIELAAARVKLFGPRQLLDRLTGTAGAEEGHALPLLTGGARDAPDRQRTLRATIAWSYDLLQPTEQLLFRRLAVFAGGWTLEMADAVCRGEGDPALARCDVEILDALASLIDKNLVRRSPASADEARFEMLRTIHEFAAGALAESGEEAALQAAHRRAYLALAEAAAERLIGPDQAAWLARLAAEHDNLRAALTRALTDEPATALRLAATLWRFWFTRGHFAEGRQRLSAALAAAGPAAPAADRALALNGLGVMAWAQADYPAAAEALAEALDLRRAAGDTQGVAASLSNLGAVAFERGDPAEARRLHDASLALRRTLGDRWGVATSLIHLGNLDVEGGDSAAAAERFGEALAISRALGDLNGIAFAVEKLGSLAAGRGDYAAARTLFEESLAAGEALGDPDAMSRALTHLGAVAREQGAYGEARAHVEQGLAARRSIDDRRGTAESLRELGNVALQAGELDQARRLYEESLAESRDLGYRNSVARNLNNLALIARAGGDYAEAQRLLAESLAEWRALGHRQAEARVLDNLGMVAAEQGDLATARERYRESLALRWAVGDRRGLASGLEGVGLVVAAEGDPLTAARLWGAAAALRESLGAPLPANERARFQAEVEAARSADPAAFDAALAAGHGLGLAAAVALAMAATQPADKQPADKQPADKQPAGQLRPEPARPGRAGQPAAGAVGPGSGPE